MKLVIDDKPLTLDTLRTIFKEPVTLTINEQLKEKVRQSSEYIQAATKREEPLYGINTGFGKLAKIRIEFKDLAKLQKNIVSSHAAGVGELLPKKVVKLILILKILALSKGLSGVSLSLIDRLCDLVNSEVFPCIPAKGSVGASGDLAPLAHLSQILIGEGYASFCGKTMKAKEALKAAKLKPIELGPKEGLALLNGTQVSTAIALSAYFDAENLFQAALYSGALTVDAIKGSKKPFDQRIHEARGQVGQKIVANELIQLLQGSEIMASHQECDRVQDPYSIRCQPQVMGACLDAMNHAASILNIEANAVTDNPLVFLDSDEIISGGNFHAEPVAFASDYLALAIAEIGSISERRCALLIDTNFSGLPAFLVKESGVNSGLMIPQVTAAALVSENKSLAHPSSVDSIPTSANQEDHVSMATHAAYRLKTMTENLSYILAIEFLSAAQGIEFHEPLQTSMPLQATMIKIREHSDSFKEDRSLSDDIKKLSDSIINGDLNGKEVNIFKVKR
ncbi:MAG: histidine ammonia-lyase [Pseudomonadota bacterium]|nr:histidine ammonia-lyase [Pseudomonadota bacterium]